MFRERILLHNKAGHCGQAMYLAKQALTICLLMLAGTQTALAQRSFDLKHSTEKLGLLHLFSIETFDDLDKVIAESSRIQDSLQLDSTSEVWQGLLWVKAKAYQWQGRGYKARGITSRLLSLTTGHEDSYLHRITLLTHSFTIRVSGAEDDDPLKYLLTALELAAKNGDKQLEFDLCLHVADMYIDLYRRDIAIEWTDRAGTILNDVYSASNCQAYYVVAADARNPQKRDKEGRLLWEDHKQQDEAFEFIHRAIECGKQAQKENDVEFVNIPLGYHIRADFWLTPEEHVFYFRKTLAESQRKKDSWAIFWGQLRLASAYLTAKMPDTTQMYLDSCRVLCAKFGNGPNITMPLYMAYYDFHEQMGKTDSMLKYLKLKYEAEAELKSNEVLIEIEKNKDKYYDAQQKVTILEQEAEIAKSEKKRRSMYAALVVFLVTALLLSILVIRVRLSNKMIKGMVEQLEDSVKEKIVLIQEVNHRVKNNLQMITMFVDMQARGIENEETLEFGNGIRKRVRAVSLVHELMLEEERLTGIPFKDYAQELVNELESIHYSGEEFKAHIDIPETSFGLSSTMYLGILLNELVSNSIKHGSKEGHPLSIWLSMKLDKDVFVFTYSDSGKAIPNPQKLKRGKSLGMYIVNSMMRQMDGSFIAEEGSAGTFIMKFPKPEDME